MQNIIFTNENCIGCNRCIASCPVPGANIAEMRNGRNYVTVDGDACIHCGHCMTVCRHFAREYIDDTDRFLADLASGEKISLAVDPSFFIDYPELAPKVLGYLKQLGVRKMYDTSFGADITTWLYSGWLAGHPGKGGITGQCTALITYLIKQHPENLDQVMPFLSPLMCLAVYVHTYLGNTDRIAYISPCIAAKDEIDAEETKGLVSYNVTFAHLFAHLDRRAEESAPAEPELSDSGLGVLYPVPGGVKENLELFIGHTRDVVELSDVIRLYPFLNQYKEVVRDDRNPVIFTALHCEFGCVIGSGVDLARTDFKTILEQCQIRRSRIYGKKEPCGNPFCRDIPHAERFKLLEDRFRSLDPHDFMCEYHERYAQPFEVPEDTCEEIFLSMHKTTLQSRHIDCQACGYNSCRKMVEAVANGYNSITNCAQYELDENKRLATTNPVTGLRNSVVFNSELGRLVALHQAAGKSVLYINIKNFMLINRQFGFPEGSRILADFARGLQKAAGQDNVFNGGADNFFVIIPYESVNKFIYDMNTMQLPELIRLQADVVTLSVRCGVYTMTGREESLQDINTAIDAAYMMAKHAKGSDIVFYDEAIGGSIVHSLIVAQQMPAALENKEFFVVYQPKVNPRTRMLDGAEALVRWKHDGKVIPPVQFVPICEANGFVKRLDFYVLNEVCGMISGWMRKGLKNVRVSVNFSKLHFSQPDVAQRILNVIDSWNVPHEYIEIEFTETSYLDTKEVLQATIRRLKDEGVTSSIDDFGTGYSSLSLLQDLDFEVLKLDKSFVDTITPDTRAEKVVANIIRMAKDLHMEVVAEGVETPDKLAELKDLHCDMIQGYIFDKPLPGEAFEKRLMNKLYSD